MSIKFIFKADGTEVNNLLAEFKQNAEAVGPAFENGFGAMGMGAVLDLFDRLKSAVGQLGEMFSSCMREALDFENVATRLGVMLNDSLAGDALASSLQRMATNGVVPLQELEKAAAALSQSLSDPQEIAEWVGVFADISAGSDLTADRLAKMVARLEDMGKAEFTELANAGVPIFEALSKVTGKTTEQLIKMGAEGKISTSVLLEALKSLTAEGEKYHNLNAEMSNTTGGSWDTLAASFAEIMADVGEYLNSEIRPILQWVSGVLQEHKRVISVIVGFLMRIVGLWGALKAIGISKMLLGCVTSLTSMRTIATALLGVFKSMGKVGWILVITGAVEALMYLYNKFNGAANAAAHVPAEDFVKKSRNKEHERAQKKQREALDAAENVEAFDRILQDGGAPAGYDVQSGRHQALMRERDKAQQEKLKKELDDLRRNEQSRVNQKHADSFKNELDAFGALDAWQQKAILERRFRALGIKMKYGADVATMRSLLDAEFASAADSGNAMKWNAVKGLEQYVNTYDSAAKRRAEQQSAQYLGLQKLDERAALAFARMAGDERKVKLIQATQEAEALAKEIESWGVSKHEARKRAASVISAEYGVDAIAPQEQSASRQYVADSLQAIGGGGRGFSLGEAQLELARKQVNVLLDSQEILSAINKKMEYLDNGVIKVVP